MKYRKAVLPLILPAFIFASCGAAPEEASSKYDMYVDFNGEISDIFECSDGWTNGNMFNCTWRKENVTFQDGKMQLIIDEDSAKTYTPYSGGEYRSKDFYGYGRYEASFKAIIATHKNTVT